jgi:hypothetical protein
MNNTLKRTLLATLGAAAFSAAQAATYTGDLLVGFTSQSGNDVIYDLGQFSALTGGESWDLSSLLGGFNLSTVSWGVVGDRNVSGTRLAWTTTSGTLPNPVANTAMWGNIDAADKGLYSNFAVGGAGTYLMITATDDNSWNEQTLNGTLPTAYHNVYQNPNLVGPSTASLFSSVADNSDPTLVGTFTLNANGGLSFVAVPEPAAWSLLGGAGLLAFALRRPLRGKA